MKDFFVPQCKDCFNWTFCQISGPHRLGFPNPIGTCGHYKTEEQPLLTLDRLAQEVIDTTQSMLSQTTILNTLHRGGIFTVDDLIYTTFDKLQNIKGAGFKRQQLMLRMRTKAREQQEKR